MNMAMRTPLRNALRMSGASLALAALPMTPSGQTFTATSGMPVRIEILASCNVAASDLDFGAYNPSAAAAAQGQSTIQLQCAPGVIAEVSLDAGTAPGANTTRRKLSSESGADRLDYGLYQDAGRSQHWGDTSEVDTRQVLTTGASQTVTIYGEIPARQTPRGGTYSDVITVRVQF
jgi:spore coat protein U domain-containing protein, fimbrial subunit CupE1/2/3/6